MENDKIQFDFKQIHNCYGFKIWISRCTNGDKQLNYHLIYSEFGKEINSYIEPNHNGNAPALIDFRTGKLEELVKEIGNFKHVIELTEDTKRLLDTYKRKGYKIKKNILVKEYS